MKKFSIAELERFSDIKAHTFRTWEHRYGISRPSRNDSNTRYYNLDTLGEILNLAILNRNGYKISHLCTLSPQQIQDRLKQSRSVDVKQSFATKELLIEMYSMNIENFEAVLDNCFLSWPVNDVFQHVIFPFLKKTKLLWMGRRTTEEHFAVTILRRKICWAIERTEIVEQNNKTVLLFLYDTKQLDLGLLYMNYLLVGAGFKVMYMGNDVSHYNLETVFDKVKPDYVYTYLLEKQFGKISELSVLMKRSLPGSKLFFTTKAGEEMPLPEHQNIANISYENALKYWKL